MQEQTLFTEALEIADEAQRATYLARACAGDEALRRRVERLLALHDRAGSFLEGPLLGETEPAGSAAVPTPQGGLGAEPPARDDGLAFLAPARRPGSLGRLEHYEVLEVLGNGGMGLVLKAFDEKLRRVVAIKVLAPHLTASGTARQRFIREAQAAAAIRDDHVVAIHAVSDEGPVPYLVMEYINGPTLDQRLKRGGPVEIKEVLRIGLQAARGLAAAHAQGLVHRDVKPGNILLENGVQRVKITDFGLARAVDDASLTRPGDIAGTPLYMSPEQACGEPVDHRSDLFSLGSVLYALCTGRPPFQGDNTAAVMKRVREDAPQPMRDAKADVPDWMQAIVAKLHAKDPAERFQSAAEVADLLGQHLAHLQQPGRVPRPAAVRFPSPRRFRRGPALASAVVLLVALGAIGAYLLFRNGEPGTAVPAGDGQAGAPSPEVRFVPPRPRTAEDLAALPNPLDNRERADVPPDLLTLAGGGDPARAPRELVAVLGDARFVLPISRPTGGQAGWMAQGPDGKVLAVPFGSDVVLFDALTGQYLRTLAEGTGRAWKAAFSPNGKYLAAGFEPPDPEPVKVWEVASGRLVRGFAGHTPRVHDLAFSPDGARLAACSEEKAVKVWDWRSGKEIFSRACPGDGRGVAFSPDGKLLAVGLSGDEPLQVWDAGTGELVHTLRDERGWAYTVAFNRDGKLLATGPPGLELWDTATLKKVRTIPEVIIEWAAFTPDGQTMLSASTDHRKGTVHTVSLWDVATGAQRAQFPLKTRGGYAAYHLSPDGKTLFAGRQDQPDGCVRAYDVATGRDRFPRRSHAGAVRAVAVSPDGRTLASGGADETVRLWDLAACRELHTLVRHTGAVWSVAFHPNGKLLASGSLDGTIILWDVSNGTEVRTLTGHSREGSLVAFSPDGGTVAAGAEDGSVRRWDVATGRRQDAFRLHQAAVRAVAFSADGRLLASAGFDGSVSVCEAATGRPLYEHASPGTDFLSLAMSPDGRHLAAGSAAPGAVRVWDLETRREQALPAGAAVNGLAFHPAGRLVAGGTADGALRLWLAGASGDPALTLGPGPFGPGVNGIAFTPEGRYLATANENGTVSILRLAKKGEVFSALAAPEK